jgi:hypothetical protein
MDDAGELLQLIDRKRFEDVHGLVDAQQIAMAWIAEHATGVGVGWVSALWYGESNEERRRAMLAALVEIADGEQQDVVAAGPLEALVVDDESRLA